MSPPSLLDTAGITTPAPTIREKKPAGVWNWTRSALARRVFQSSRWLHIYLSTALFSLLVFFCFTGVLLNHPDWLSASAQQTRIEQSLPAAVNTALNDDSLKPLQEYLSRQYSLPAPSTVELDVELGEVTLDYSLPAGYAFVTVWPEEGTFEIEHQSGGLVALLNDLHKGRDSGVMWSWLIDVSASAMLLFAFTGLIILMQQVKYRQAGLWLVLLGTLTPWLLYLAWVPRLSL